MVFKRDLGVKDKREECKDAKEWLRGLFNDTRL